MIAIDLVASSDVDYNSQISFKIVSVFVSVCEYKLPLPWLSALPETRSNNKAISNFRISISGSYQRNCVLHL